MFSMSVSTYVSSLAMVQIVAIHLNGVAKVTTKMFIPTPSLQPLMAFNRKVIIFSNDPVH